MAGVWKAAGIDIVSMASNHAMDWGPDALLDTIDLFRGMGKHVIGAGRDGEEARKPAIVERNGVKIAILAYCSVLRSGQAAGEGKVGIAPMRAHTYYAPEEFQPGTPPKIITVPYEEDVLALQEDIRKAKQQADVVIMSIHWGLRHVPKTICTYQPPVAHAAIDAGADLILGTPCAFDQGGGGLQRQGLLLQHRQFHDRRGRRRPRRGFGMESDLVPDRGRVHAAQGHVQLSAPLPQDHGAENHHRQARHRESLVPARVYQSPGSTVCRRPGRSQVQGDTGVYGVGLRPALLTNSGSKAARSLSTLRLDVLPTSSLGSRVQSFKFQVSSLKFPFQSRGSSPGSKVSSLEF